MRMELASAGTNPDPLEAGALPLEQEVILIRRHPIVAGKSVDVAQWDFFELPRLGISMHVHCAGCPLSTIFAASISPRHFARRGQGGGGLRGEEGAPL